MARIMLHICCAPCSTHCIEALRSEGVLVGVFINPNIQPEEEFKKRLEEARELSRKLEIEFVETNYDPEAWNASMRGLENEPEGGIRCEVCFRVRLEEAARLAAENNCDSLTSTLTVSPYKNTTLIHRLGMEAAERYGIVFREDDFKKKGGFQRSLALSREHNLYRQNYCGCLFSRRDKK
jgi:predicted adenine nucleotide alpha hydrolase (AANH) superfamily ATPase